MHPTGSQYTHFFAFKGWGERVKVCCWVRSLPSTKEIWEIQQWEIPTVCWVPRQHGCCWKWDGVTWLYKRMDWTHQQRWSFPHQWWNISVLLYTWILCEKPTCKSSATFHFRNQTYCNQHCNGKWRSVVPLVNDRSWHWWGTYKWTILQEIVMLWVTIRGFAVAASWLEHYKEEARTTTKKSRGLRKKLSQREPDNEGFWIAYFVQCVIIQS